ncbi:scaffolding protein [Acinetobacter phage vB_AbaP_AS12]|uniref:Scaffolding protein n=1 Tax=Acinetobacter phage vB_AbaP_AS12 TaxID=1932885 RepID=A0A218KRC9_9CAUD|nr:head scaffolding protein [Acinetobacter phage vB_AbaP_AS12]APW79821.1 scaffolding protein [Acinetobacter phage vB_AbaP_AS12]
MSEFNTGGQGNPQENTPQGGQGNPAPQGFNQGGQGNFQQQFNPNFNQSQFGFQQNQAYQAPQVNPTPAPVEDPTPTQPTKVYTPEDFAGDSPLDVSIKVVSANAGLSEEAFGAAIKNAVQYGNADLIDVATLTKGLEPNIAAQVVATARAAYQHATQLKAQITQKAHAAAGGAEQWQEAINSFNTSAPQDVRGYAIYLESIGKQDEAIQVIMNHVRGAGLVNSSNGALLDGSTGGTGGKAMSHQEFLVEWGKLDRQYGHQLYSNKEAQLKIADLQRRRALGKQQGI